jgi:hypothetical protein
VRLVGIKVHGKAVMEHPELNFVEIVFPFAKIFQLVMVAEPLSADEMANTDKRSLVGRYERALHFLTGRSRYALFGNGRQFAEQRDGYKNRLGFAADGLPSASRVCGAEASRDADGHPGRVAGGTEGSCQKT